MENKKINKVETEVNGAVLVIRFDRPEKATLTIGMYARLNEILQEASIIQRLGVLYSAALLIPLQLETISKIFYTMPKLI